eukprot:TRINITY_DN2615_c0_g1_i1.p1 TRINITY_DN2615_c0_g1~~TRINITY_DN2615_c0_g1_i1.p1  ORF type:complete len:391 (+),score=62.08 TRINITY_DN2615_c0_g1_i1:26-1198(+)
MGRGGESYAVVHDVAKMVTDRAPSEKPPFTIGDLKRAIPPHCFKRSLLWSSAYLLFDLTIIVALYLSTTLFDHPALPRAATHLLWVAYWAAQGCVATGVWVIAHECGHQAFSEAGWINDTVGMVLHTCLLVPYFSWKYSHRRHHSNTGSVEKDEVFVPLKKHDVTVESEFLQHPAGRLIFIVATLIFGWPMYLTFNSTGRKYEGIANHFYPGSSIFNNKERPLVLLSDLSLLAALGVLYKLGTTYGFGWLFQVYGVPLLIVNAFLVLITLLQHTHTELPHYDATEWDWLRGALATVDRDYGILNHVLHHITDTHVAHHLFSTMPHYHAMEATKAIKPILGSYYRFDSTPIPQALWRDVGHCVYVSPDAGKDAPKGVLWFQGPDAKRAAKE